MGARDVLVLGMTIFALFLGAGNVIFPPWEGFLAGDYWVLSAFGFVLTGVFLPFVTLLVVSVLGRGEVLSEPLPKWVGLCFWTALYLIIGSLFAMPRVSNVAYEMGFLPLKLTSFADFGVQHMVFVLLFNLLGLGFMLHRNSIITTVGKILTPLLLFLLLLVAFMVIKAPLASVHEAQGAYLKQSALSSGLVAGYQTMDVLAATAFGGIVARAFFLRKIHSKGMILKYTFWAGAVSVLLLSLLYMALFYMGATSSGISEGASNGGQIFSRYIDALFGRLGVWVMSGIVILANLTTLVGVSSACADYFARTFSHRLSYAFWAVFFSLLTSVVSYLGLDLLLKITLPALYLIYPLAIVLVVLALLRPFLKEVRRVYMFVFFVVAFFSALDSLREIGILPSLHARLGFLPLYNQGLAWLLPFFFALVFVLFYDFYLRRRSE